jgi:hypothetical protein
MVYTDFSSFSNVPLWWRRVCLVKLEKSSDTLTNADAVPVGLAHAAVISEK